MAEVFGHERLKVYRKGMEFVAIRREFLDSISRRVAACDHLDRGAESILLNIAHASSSWSPKERIVYLLIAMRETAANRVGEEHSTYRTARQDNFFSHEDLDVYQVALQFTGWVEGVCMESSCSADLRSKLDKSSTAIVLNIAEGNGRFSGTDQAKFLGIAYKATVQSASLVDLAAASISAGPKRVQEGRAMLRRIAAMLTSLSKVAAQNT